jgi:hypothetical protein
LAGDRDGQDDRLQRAMEQLHGPNGDLLPTPSLTPEEFEAFTHRLLAAHRHALPSAGRRILRVERWGRSGDKQDGIDLLATWSDGTTATFQCKRWQNLTPSQVDEIVADTDYAADEHNIVYSKIASAPARKRLHTHDSWVLLDQRDLTELWSDLPLQRRRDVVDATWTAEFRRQWMPSPSSDAFVSTSVLVCDRARPGRALNDAASFVGMSEQRDRVREFLEAPIGGAAALIVSGPGGTGKTRLLLESLSVFEEEHPQTPVLWLAAGVPGSDALQELPLVPTVIVIDDAHENISRLQGLLRHVHSHDGTRLVLASRVPAVKELRRELVRGNVPVNRIVEVTTGSLSRNAAETLVDDLAAGLQLSYAFRSQLAAIAMDTPAVAVLAVNLLRAGLLTNPYPLNEALRTEVMARFGQSMLVDVDGAPAHAVPLVAAVIAAIGAFNLDDDVQVHAASSVAEVTRLQLLRIVDALRDRGSVTGPEGALRISVEIFGDQVLEEAALIGGRDSGFVARLWQQFGAVTPGPLLANLGNLDWRLQQRGERGVLHDVWAVVHAQLNDWGHSALVDFLRRIGQLAFTQPRALVDVLDAIRQRLNVLDVSDSVEDVLPWSWARVTRSDVEHRLAALYADAATNEAVLLPHVLQALWSLGQSDDRPENPHPDHAFRLIRERFSSYSARPVALSQQQVLAAVSGWLSKPSDETAGRHAMLLLAPMLSKTGTSTQMTDRSTVTLRSWVVPAAPVRSLRDGARALFEAHPERIREVVELSTAALRPPLPGFGATATDEDVLSWADDDVATVLTLRRLSAATTIPAVRRGIRSAVDWAASGARSDLVRLTAMQLVADLDAVAGDDFADLLVSDGRRTPHQRLHEDRQDRYQLTARIGSFAAALRQVWPDEFTVDGLQFVDAQLRAAERVCGPREWQARLIAFALVEELPELAGPVLLALVDAEPGPLDAALVTLVGSARDDVVAQLTDRYPTLRVAVREAVGRAAAHERWRNGKPAAAKLLAAGRADLDLRVRQGFLAAADLTAPLQSISDELLAGAASADTIDVVLQDLHFDVLGDGAVPEIAASDVPPLLDLLRVLPDRASTLPKALAAAARSDPRRTLEFLNESRDGLFDPEAYNLFDGADAVVSGWLLELVDAVEPTQVAPAVSAAIGAPLPAEVAEHLAVAVPTLPIATVEVLSHLLAGFSAWAAHRPALARTMLTHPDRRVPSDDVLHETLARAATPVSWSTGSWGAPELNSAIAAAEAALPTERNLELHNILRDAVSSMRAWLRDDTDDE